MRSFEEQRIEYFKRIGKHTVTITKLAEDIKNKRVVEILLDPKNEKELEFANAYFDFLEDTIRISVNALYENMEKINLNDSLFVDYMSKLIIIARENIDNIDDIKALTDMVETDKNKALARILYEMAVTSFTDPEGFVNALCSKCNIDFTNESELVRLRTTLSEAKERISLDIPSVEEERDFAKFIELVKQYHDFYINGLIDQNNINVKEMLIQSLIEEDDSPQISEGRSRSRNIQTEVK